MKLIFCPECQDVRKLLDKLTTCSCGKSSGEYLDNLNAYIFGDAIPLGFANRTFVRALRNRPGDGMGAEFVAFVIPEQCDTIEVKK